MRSLSSTQQDNLGHHLAMEYSGVGMTELVIGSLYSRALHRILHISRKNFDSEEVYINIHKIYKYDIFK